MREQVPGKACKCPALQPLGCLRQRKGHELGPDPSGSSSLLPSFEKQCAAAQDLVAALTSPGWWATAKVDQSRTLKDGAGNAIWENTTPFKYHNGWLSVYWTAYQ